MSTQIGSLYEPVVAELKKSGYVRISEGNSRRVYAKDKSHVIKLPTNIKGVSDSDREAQEFSKRGKFGGYIHRAACHIEMIHQAPILKMEFIEEIPVTPDVRKENRWVDFVDCGEVGVDQEGNIVAYDYA